MLLLLKHQVKGVKINLNNSHSNLLLRHQVGETKINFNNSQVGVSIWKRKLISYR